MNIAFDVDGVFTDIEKFQLQVGSKFFAKKYNQQIVDESGYGIKEVFNCTDNQEIEFWIKNTLKYLKTVKPRVGTSATLKKLHEEGNKIFIISSRAMTTETNLFGIIMRSLIRKWLKDNKIYYDEMIFCSVKNSSIDKMTACKENNIDIVVEDKKENISEISKIIPTLCFSTKNNELYEENNVYRVNNFDEVYTKIKQLQTKENKFQLLNSNQKSKLDKESLINYYEKMREYYLNLPYDEKTAETNKKNCLKVLNILRFIFNRVYNPINLSNNKLTDYHGVIFASNHLHAFDPLALINAGITDFRLLAKEELQEQKIGKLFEYIGSIFVDNTSLYSKQISKNELIKTVLHGNNVMMFPEGTRNKTEEFLLDFKYGTVSIAQVTGAPIIPCALNKDYRIIGGKLIVNIGNPIFIKPEESLEDANEKLKNEITELLLEIKQYEKENQKTKVK